MPVTTPTAKLTRKQPAPVLGHLQVGLVPRPRVARLHEGHQDGEPEGERDEEEVEDGDGGELDARECFDRHGSPFLLELAHPPPGCQSRSFARTLGRDDRHLRLAAAERQAFPSGRWPSTIALGELSGILLILQTALLVRIADDVIFSLRRRRLSSRPVRCPGCARARAIHGFMGDSAGRIRVRFARVKQAVRSDA